MTHYRDDLAWIHHAGFSEFAESAAPFILSLLPRDGGLVIDTGCGSGVLARHLTDAGHHVLGIDASPAMLALARAHAPAARFALARFADAALPPCSAIVACGEVLNYGSLEDVQRFITHAADALRDGGLLLFDIAERGSYPAYDEHRSGGEDWSVIATKKSDGARVTRRVLTFRQIEGETRRDEEVHELALYDRDEITRMLRDAGFTVKTRRSYGAYRLPRGHKAYIAFLGVPRSSSGSSGSSA